jgi:hypothetical protein
VEQTLPVDLKQSYVLHGFTYFERATEPEKAKLKMLVCIPSPRDIEQFFDSVKSSLTAYDKVWIKYYQQKDRPYSVLRRSFLRHANRAGYTHLAILPDDLVIHREGVDKLVGNVVSNPNIYNVMMGSCNVELGSPFVAITKNLPSMIRSQRVYQWYTAEEVKGKGIMKVKHCGTPFAIISRYAFDRISLDNDRRWNNNNDSVGYSEDIVLSHDLAKRKIPIYVDCSVQFLHLKEPTKPTP